MFSYALHYTAIAVIRYMQLLHYTSCYDWEGVTVGGRIYERNAQTLENIPTPLFGEPLKFIAHGRTFERSR